MCNYLLEMLEMDESFAQQLKEIRLNDVNHFCFEKLEIDVVIPLECHAHLDETLFVIFAKKSYMKKMFQLRRNA